MPRTKAREPMWLSSEMDGRRLLASSYDQAAAFVTDKYGDESKVSIEPDGWGCNVGWDREQYETKREFLAESGYESWWEYQAGDHDLHEETARFRRLWKVTSDA